MRETDLYAPVKRLLEGQGLRRVVLHLERAPADLLKDLDRTQLADRFRPAQVDRGVLCRRMAHAGHGKLGHVPERNPTDRVLARAIDLRRRVSRVKADCRAEPDLHKVPGAKDRIV